MRHARMAGQEKPAAWVWRSRGTPSSGFAQAARRYPAIPKRGCQAD